MDNPFGTVELPQTITDRYLTVEEGAIGNFINLGLNVLVIAAGIYAVVNLILAGYAFMSAGDDSKKVAGAWAKIWQTLLGVAVSAGAFVLAAIFGRIIFGDADALLKPIIPTP